MFCRFDIINRVMLGDPNLTAFPQVVTFFCNKAGMRISAGSDIGVIRIVHGYGGWAHTGAWSVSPTRFYHHFGQI